MKKLFLTLSVLLSAISGLAAIYVKQQGQTAAFGAGAVAGDLALYGPAGGVAILGGTNAWLGGGKEGDIISGATVGIFSGLAGGAVGQWAAQYLGGVVISGTSINNYVLKGAIGGAIGGAAGGYASGFTAGMITTGDIKEAHKAGLSGLYSGAAIGGVTGAISGYKYAKDNGISPRTGEKILYRAVSEAEYNDILSNGFRSNPDGSGYQEEKLFYRNYKDAVTTTKFYDSKFNQQSIILEVRGPNTNIYTPGYMDFVPTYSVQKQYLPLLKTYKIR
jgi:hypothetical protein